MTSEHEAAERLPAREEFDDDVTWHGLVDRAMRAGREGLPDTSADRRVLAVLRAAMGAGLDGVLLAGMRAEAHAYVMSLLRPTD